jgi:hypothetical protein
MLVIAGVTSPWKESDIKRWVRDARQKVPEDSQKWVDMLGENMIAMTDGLGDGLVTVESTRLEGVSHRTVDGNHLSMIRNVNTGSRRIPPAGMMQNPSTVRSIFNEIAHHRTGFRAAGALYKSGFYICRRQARPGKDIRCSNSSRVSRQSMHQQPPQAPRSPKSVSKSDHLSLVTGTNVILMPVVVMMQSILFFRIPFP